MKQFKLISICGIMLMLLMCFSAGCITIQMPSDSPKLTPISTSIPTPTSTPIPSYANPSIVGSWYLDEGDAWATVKFYNNGLGNWYAFFEKGTVIEGYDELGYYGDIKSYAYDLTYEKISEDNYLVIGTSFYAEMYNGQIVYVPENERCAMVLGEVIVYSYDKIGFKFDDDDPIAILNRI